MIDAVSCRNALVLTGGESRRMGRDKAALEVAGETQLDRTVRVLSPLVDTVHVSIRPDQESDPQRNRYPVIVDRYDNLGPLAGILSALQTIAEPWLIVACDLPLLDTNTLTFLLANIDDESIATAYRSQYDELPEPLCAVWMPGALPVSLAAVENGRTCPRKILIVNNATLLELPVAGALDNANTPQDLARITGV